MNRYEIVVVEIVSPRTAAVEGGHRLGPVRSHDPGRSGAGQGEDEHHGPDTAQDQARSGKRRGPVGGDMPAVDGEHGLDGVQEPGQPGEQAHREHDHDGQDRDTVREHRRDTRRQERLRHIALGIGHLLGRGRRHFQAGVIENQHRHQADEYGIAGCEGVTAYAVNPVFRGVHNDRDHEKCQY